MESPSLPAPAARAAPARPFRLVDEHGWDELELIQRYTGLGLACLAVLALRYAVGLWRARTALRSLEQPPGA